MRFRAVTAVSSYSPTTPSKTWTGSWRRSISTSALGRRSSPLVLFIWWVGRTESEREHNWYYIQIIAYSARFSWLFFCLFPGKESTLKDSDLEHFTRQASCLGFSREPDFRHDPKKGASPLKLFQQAVRHQIELTSLSFSLQNSVRKARASSCRSPEAKNNFHDKYSNWNHLTCGRCLFFQDCCNPIKCCNTEVFKLRLPRANFC